MSKLTPNPSYSVSMLIELPNTAGKLATVINALAAEGGNLSHIDLIEQSRKITVRKLRLMLLVMSMWKI
jgi:malate dehydrogenase (oxaloacetate-decarboxylating)